MGAEWLLINSGAMLARKIYADYYREQMDFLIKSRLKFEAYSKQANERQLFFAQGENLKESLQNNRSISTELLWNPEKARDG